MAVYFGTLKELASVNGVLNTTKLTLAHQVGKNFGDRVPWHHAVCTLENLARFYKKHSKDIPQYLLKIPFFVDIVFSGGEIEKKKILFRWSLTKVPDIVIDLKGSAIVYTDRLGYIDRHTARDIDELFKEYKNYILKKHSESKPQEYREPEKLAA